MFLILAPPRSRTFWLSKFLSYGDYECGHEEARHLRTIDDARLWLSQSNHGSAETAIAPWWRLIVDANPNLKIVVVRRPVDEVIESLMALDLEGVCAFDRALLTRDIRMIDAKLVQIAKRVPGALSVDFHALDNADVLAAVFEHCLPYQFDRRWWEALRSVNLQCNMRDIMRHAQTYRAPLQRMVQAATFLSRRKLMLRPVIAPQGVTIQQEDFESWYRDGQPLFEQHCVAIGEAPDDWKTRNFPLMKQLYDGGVLQITTARCNGKMFGYLFAIVSPSLESTEWTCGGHNLFFASDEIPGIGLKMLRASTLALSARGVTDIFFQEGIRGSGPRIGVLYNRLGAEHFGVTHRMRTGG